MISIINKGPHTKDLGGERNYEVRINDELICTFKHKRICTFKHKRIGGLAACLMAAAKAVEEKKWRDFEELLARFPERTGGVNADF